MMVGLCPSILFGHKNAEGKPAPFHLYSTRQAIEEGFILDVLRGYITYQRFFKLAKAVATDPNLDKRKAASALARFVNLNPSNIAQKTEIFARISSVQYRIALVVPAAHGHVHPAAL